ncbi:MAG: trimethylamine methyltransferase family protein, partial [Anaerolineales bacterium]
GVEPLTETLATALFAGINFKADFLKQKETRALFAKEQFLPSRVIDRASLRTWKDSGKPDAWTRARAETQRLLDSYQRPAAAPETEAALTDLMARLARDAGMESLPALP